MRTEVHTMSYYGDKADSYETATFELEWDPNDPRIENFCDSPYLTVLHYKILKDGTKEFVSVAIDGKMFKPE